MEYLQKHIIMYVNLANFIKTKRKEANLTQQEFAERAGVALQWFGK
jgi:transcriptional regulator with XRE-family HTH domain